MIGAAPFGAPRMVMSLLKHERDLRAARGRTGGGRQGLGARGGDVYNRYCRV